MNGLLDLWICVEREEERTLQSRKEQRRADDVMHVAYVSFDSERR